MVLKGLFVGKWLETNITGKLRFVLPGRTPSVTWKQSRFRKSLDVSEPCGLSSLKLLKDASCKQSRKFFLCAYWHDCNTSSLLWKLCHNIRKGIAKMFLVRPNFDLKRKKVVGQIGFGAKTLFQKIAFPDIWRHHFWVHQIHVGLKIWGSGEVSVTWYTQGQSHVTRRVVLQRFLARETLFTILAGKPFKCWWIPTT